MLTVWSYASGASGVGGEDGGCEGAEKHQCFDASHDGEFGEENCICWVWCWRANGLLEAYCWIGDPKDASLIFGECFG